ncbi:MAG: cytochrome C biogenesis protein [Deltaproteobacteria bacterium HGW-Deltaproteobacteria-21]|nr:MAG: cytochrome C biogenesis protein [Deltaproteobacteria bacterium HGW-Deltaproteobacteria-21]
MINRILLGLALALFSILFPLVHSHAATVRVEVIHSQEWYAAGKEYPLAFRLSIQKPWFIHGNEAGEEEIIPTALRFERSPGVVIENIHFPRPEKMKFDYAPGSVDVFSGQLLVSASLRVADGAGAGEQIIQGRLSYQACSPTACLPPEEVSIPVRVTVASSTASAERINNEVFDDLSLEDIRERSSQQGQETAFWITLLGLFIGGLALNLTPCIYPLIPITVSFFTGRAQRSTLTVILHASLYMLGLAMTNAALGLFAALSGSMIGSALQNSWVILFIALILIVLATSFFGFWDFRLPPALTRFAAKDYGGSLGSLFMGLTLGIVAAPCIGPFILGLLTYVGQKGDPLLGFLYFFVLSLGLGLPLAVLALFSGALRKLPLSGDWMIWVRKLMGWVLVGMAAYIIGPLIPSSTGELILISAVALAAAVHLGWVDRSGMRQKRFLLIKRIVGIAVAAAAMVVLVLSMYGREGIRWAPYDPDLLSRASADGKPVMLDFYADWCSPCKILEKSVFREPEVVELSRGFVAMRVDLTTRDEGEDEVLSRYKIRGVPTVLFLDKAGKEQRDLRIESLVDRSEVLERMRKALGPEK